MQPGPDVARDPSLARRAWIGLALLVVAAAALRWPATTRLLPHSPEPDAYYVQLAQSYREDPALIQHVEFAERYPVLLARVLSFLPWPAPVAAPERADAAEAMLRAGAGPYLAGRWLALAFALLAIPGTWLVARRLAGEAAAWIASALVATSMLHALFATQARPHAPQAALAVWAVWAAMRLAERERGEREPVRRAALAAGLASLSLCTLQIGAATLPPLAVAAWLAGGTLARRIARVTLLPLVAIVGAFWAYPFALRFDGGGLRLGGHGAHEVDFAAVDFSGFQTLARKLLEHDPLLGVLLALALAALVVRWRASARAVRENRDVLVACAYAIPFLAVVGPLNEVFERFLLPLLPWIATLGAAFVVRIAGARTWRAAAAGALVVAAPTLMLAHFARVAAAPDSSEVVVAWLAAQGDEPAASVVTSPGLVLPVAYEARALRADLDDRGGRSSPWPKYQGTRPDAEFPRWRLPLYLMPAPLAQKPEPGLAAWLDSVAPRYVVLERSKRSLFLPGGRALANFARDRGTLVFRTDGEAPGIEEQGQLHYQTMDDFARRLLATERFGAALEVWRIDR